MQKFNNFYFHSVRFNFDILEDILKSGYILSREKCNSPKNTLNFNGNKWISICEYYEPYYWVDYSIYKSAYQLLVVNGISLVLDNKLEAIKTIFMTSDELYPGLIKEENPIRYSDCIDEYQVRDSISKDHFLALTYPYLYMLDKDKVKAQCEYDKVRYLLDKFHYELPLIDSSYDVFDGELDKLEKKLKK